MKKLTFKEAVYDVVRRIPKGETMTYKGVAERIGRPGACRAVGTALSQNHDPKIPCHRVIRSDGKLGGYNRGKEEKRRILEMESGTL